MDVLAVVGEGLGMFLLLATIVAVAVDRRASAGFAGLLVGGALAALACVLVAQPERASVEAELPRGSAGDVVGRRVVPHGERSAGETTPTIEGRTRHVR
jgi:uncharacterized protein (DUF58 family)